MTVITAEMIESFAGTVKGNSTSVAIAAAGNFAPDSVSRYNQIAGLKMGGCFVAR